MYVNDMELKRFPAVKKINSKEIACIEDFCSMSTVKVNYFISLNQRKSHSILMLINRHSQQFHVIYRTQNLAVICILKIGHVTIVRIEKCHVDYAFLTFAFVRIVLKFGSVIDST